jgi:hypothetical protein
MCVTPPWFLRENSGHHIASISNASIHYGSVPSLWKSANVIPAAKSSTALDVDSDFRPISLTPIVSKILESFPYNWLLQPIRDQIYKLQYYKWEIDSPKGYWAVNFPRA